MIRHQSIVWGACCMLLSGCVNKSPQPQTSPFQTTVTYQSQVLIDIKVDVYEKEGGVWKVFASGISTSPQPFPLILIDQTKRFPDSGECRVTLESVGASVLPIKPVYRDPSKTPIVWKAPLSPGNTEIVLPKDGLK
jgi:hypothetical protein